MSRWAGCRNILVIRPDNMGDLLMSAPAIAALKESFGCKISLLTSSRAKAIAGFLPTLDDVLIYDVPWVRHKDPTTIHQDFSTIINNLRQKNFDAAVIFTVFSQNPLPSAMLACLSGIPQRLAYCRENPYDLLTEWVLEEEPYTFIRHQVKRDIDLVRHIGAVATDERIRISLPESSELLRKKMNHAGIRHDRPWIVLHPGASELKRRCPVQLWIEAGRQIVRELAHQVLITGSADECRLTTCIQSGIGTGAFTLAGELDMGEFIELIRQAPLVITVNTATAHIAAATQTRVLVLYALTNPQHTPWMATGKILPFAVPEHLQSKNEVLRYTCQKFFRKAPPLPTAGDIVRATRELLAGGVGSRIPELIVTR